MSVVPSASFPPGALEGLVRGRCPDPGAVLGPFAVAGTWMVRLFLPGATTVALNTDAGTHDARRVHEAGLFEARGLGPERPLRYRVSWTDADGAAHEATDPYQYRDLIDEATLKAFARGELLRPDRCLGAHLLRIDGVEGTRFAVWAPHAHAVSLIGSFNGWDPRRHPLLPRPQAGVWELFVPEVGEGVLYKYTIHAATEGAKIDKADPYGFAMQLRPDTASVVHRLEGYSWRDDAWMRSRGVRQAGAAPISIYEVHLGSWRRHERHGDDEGWFTYRELAEELVPYAVRMGFTHLELLPVTEHPYDASWGYQTVGYFAPTSRFGSPDDFRHFVDTAHQAGLGVILDWVPGHFPRDGHGLVYFDGTHLYEPHHPLRRDQPDWGTYVFDYGSPRVRAFLVASALFWLEQYHVDGLRVDAVAAMLHLDFSKKEGEWIPNPYGGRENLDAVTFLRQLNVAVHEQFPGALTFAEESSAWPKVSHPVHEGGLGFDLKWNMGWMNDLLRYVKADPLFRRSMHDVVTFSIHYAFSERFLLPLSHDEVVHGKASLLSKMPGEAAAAQAQLRLMLAYQMTHPGKKLLFMGGEFGQWREWDYQGQLDWDLLRYDPHRHLSDTVRELNALYARERALHELDFDWRGFRWLDRLDCDRSVVAFLRMAADGHECVAVVANFTPMTWSNYVLGVPTTGTYMVLFNSDWKRFGGSSADGGPHPLPAHEVPCQDQPCSLTLDVPSFGLLVLKRRADDQPA